MKISTWFLRIQIMTRKLFVSIFLVLMVSMLTLWGFLFSSVFGKDPSVNRLHEQTKESSLKINAGKHLRDYSPIPEEPDEFDDREVKAYYDWRNDLFFRKFDMNGSGSVDYMTARRTYKVWLDEFGTPVVVTVGSPLFYWVDRNGNGEFETGKGEMWSDPNEDGITGEERIYDTSHLENHPSRIPQWQAPAPQ